jgi:hypothetical protein
MLAVPPPRAASHRRPSGAPIAAPKDPADLVPLQLVHRPEQMIALATGVAHCIPALPIVEKSSSATAVVA